MDLRRFNVPTLHVFILETELYLQVVHIHICCPLGFSGVFGSRGRGVVPLWIPRTLASGGKGAAAGLCN